MLLYIIKFNTNTSNIILLRTNYKNKNLYEECMVTADLKSGKLIIKGI